MYKVEQNVRKSKMRNEQQVYIASTGVPLSSTSSLGELVRMHLHCQGAAPRCGVGGVAWNISSVFHLAC